MPPRWWCTIAASSCSIGGKLEEEEEEEQAPTWILRARAVVACLRACASEPCSNRRA